MTGEILVIDDDPVITRLIGLALSDYSVTTASTGEEGLQIFAEKPFDLVICDIVMPGMGGLEAIHRLRLFRPEQRIMLVSSFGTQENLLASLRERVVDFLVKPFDPAQLQSAVRNLLACDRAIKVISASRNWIELKVPARFQVAASLDRFFAALQSDVDETTRGDVSLAFRELINNAIEHGCKGDPDGMVTVSYVRMKRCIIYRIKDPGAGFDMGAIPHAAVSNPEGKALHHMQVREQQGMRPGGYGLLWLRHLADELVYNDRGNDVLFIKYVD